MPSTSQPPPAAAGSGRLAFLVRNAVSLVSTSFLTSGLGFVFWAAAARFFEPTTLGESAAALAAMNLLAPLATLGFGTLLMAQLPTMRTQRAGLVMSAALASTAAGAVLALVAALVVPTSFLGLPGIGNQVGATALFAGGVAAQALGLVLDQALLSTAGGSIQLARNAVVSVVKILALVGFALLVSGTASLSVYASWMLGNVLSIVVAGAWIWRAKRLTWRRLRPSARQLGRLRRDAVQHHALNLALSVPYFAMPIIANANLGSRDAGYLYATWSVAGFVFVLPIALATSLFASGARDASRFVHDFRFSLRASLAACVAAIVILVPLGGLVLRLFGADYERAGRTALILLCLAGLGLVIKDHHVTVARVRGRVGREAVLVWLLTLVELVAATVGARTGGLNGLAAGWLLAVALEAVVYTSQVVRTYRGAEESRAASDLDRSGSVSISR